MRNGGRINAVLIAVLFLVATPAAAQEFQPRNVYEELIQRLRPQPDNPRDLRIVILEASLDRLLTRAFDGIGLARGMSGCERGRAPIVTGTDAERRSMWDSAAPPTSEMRVNGTEVSPVATEPESPYHPGVGRE